MKFYINYKKCTIEESKRIINKRELKEVPIIKKSKIFADKVFYYK